MSCLHSAATCPMCQIVSDDVLESYNHGFRSHPNVGVLANWVESLNEEIYQKTAFPNPVKMIHLDRGFMKSHLYANIGFDVNGVFFAPARDTRIGMLRSPQGYVFKTMIGNELHENVQDAAKLGQHVVRCITDGARAAIWELEKPLQKFEHAREPEDAAYCERQALGWMEKARKMGL